MSAFAPLLQAKRTAVANVVRDEIDGLEWVVNKPRHDLSI
jgi:hypothetical protein